MLTIINSIIISIIIGIIIIGRHRHDMLTTTPATTTITTITVIGTGTAC